MAGAEKSWDEKWDSKFDSFKKDVMEILSQQGSNSRGNIPNGNLNNYYGRGQGRGNQNRDFNRKNPNISNPRGGRRGRNNWTGNGNRGNRVVNHSRGNSRGRGRGTIPRENQDQERYYDVFEDAQDSQSARPEAETSKSLKKIYVNPLIPKDSRISKILTEEEVEVLKGKFGTNAEQQYLKQFMSFSIDEAQSNVTRCACELIIHCIPGFWGSYAQNEAHDLRQATILLKANDPLFKDQEIIHVYRHPGQKEADGKLLRVTVLFSNSVTPDRIATKAEELRDTKVFQRSLTRGLREKNKTMGDYIYNLNLLRPKNCPYLWSSVVLKGEIHKIQRSDPSFVPEPEMPKKPETNPAKKGPKGAIQALKEVNRKLAETGPEAPMDNVPGLTVEDTLEELKIKHGGNMTLACQELLMIQGVPDRKDLRSKARTPSNV